MKPSSIKPLMYGYIRVESDALDNDVQQMELVLRDYAAREGYDFASIFYEYGTDGRVLAELVEELGRSEARHVVMPTLNHLATHALLRDFRLAQLEADAEVQVHTLGD